MALAAAAASGLALLLSFPLYGHWWLAPLGVGLLALAVHGRRLRAGLGMGLISGAVFFGPLLAWTNLHVGYAPWVLLTLFQASYFMLLGGALAWIGPLAWRASRRWAWVWPVLIGLLWVAQEALRDTAPFGGFPWGRLAFSQADAPALRFASLGGAPLVTFAVALAGGTLALAASRLLTRQLHYAEPAEPTAFAELTAEFRLLPDGPTAEHPFLPDGPTAEHPLLPEGPTAEHPLVPDSPTAEHELVPSRVLAASATRRDSVSASVGSAASGRSPGDDLPTPSAPGDASALDELDLAASDLADELAADLSGPLSDAEPPRLSALAAETADLDSSAPAAGLASSADAASAEAEAPDSTADAPASSSTAAAGAPDSTASAAAADSAGAADSTAEGAAPGSADDAGSGDDAADKPEADQADGAEEDSEGEKKSSLDWIPVVVAAVRRPFPGRPIAVPALVTALLMAVGLLIPLAQPSGRPVVVAVIQGNVPRMGLDFNAQRKAVLDNHVNATLELAFRVRNGQAPQPDLVVWPENASDIDPLRNSDAAAVIDYAARTIKAPILVGAVLSGPGEGQSRNAGIAWSPLSGAGEMYLKQHPVPFAEYLPLRSIVEPIAQMITNEAKLLRTDFVAGTTSGVLQMGPVKVGDVICFEVAYDGLVRDTVRSGAELLTVQTNNATFDEAEAAQQLAMVRLRSVEHGRDGMMASTVGISAFVSADGTVQDATDFNRAAGIVRTLHAGGSTTLATRVGEWPELILTLLAVSALLAAGYVRRRARNGIRAGGST